jgi:hypothetical protein
LIVFKIENPASQGGHMHPYQATAALLKAEKETGVKFSLDDELGPGDFELVPEAPNNDNIVEARIALSTLLLSIGTVVSILTGAKSRFWTFISNIPIIGFIILKIRAELIIQRYFAEFNN